MSVIVYAIISVVIVSLISLIGILTLSSKKDWNKHLLFLVSLSAGTLFGGAFLHLLPEAVETNGFSLQVSLLLLLGVLIFFLLEKFVHLHHCHHEVHHAHMGVEHHKKHLTKHSTNKALVPLNLAGDALHNLLDGLIIAGSYLVSIPAGIATTVAVIFHEIPQEIADFGVLLYSGMSKTKALLYNFGSATFAIIGTVAGLVLGVKSQSFVNFILPLAAGGFVYIAGSNLIPELHKDCELKSSFWHFLAMVVGIIIMVALLFLE
jgi:zinc and cadmium transporter